MTNEQLDEKVKKWLCGFGLNYDRTEFNNGSPPLVRYRKFEGEINISLEIARQLYLDREKAILKARIKALEAKSRNYPEYVVKVTDRLKQKLEELERVE